MSLSNIHHKFLETFACAHVSDGFMENDEDSMLGYFMELQGSTPLVVAEVRELKDKGNGYYRNNEFDMAAACYDEACKLFSLSLGNIGGENIQSLSDLAVSLLSNMAACALKLKEYRAASGMCSMILDTFPQNVKALFRRAIASIKLKRFSRAELDLVEALAVEPGNKDVLRELQVVRGHLLIKENGKRELEVEDRVDGNKKKHIHASTSDEGKEDNASVITEVKEDHSDVSMKDTESVNMEETEPQYIGGTKKSVLEFSKMGGGCSRLRIPAQDYKKLLDGKKLSFVRKRDLTTLTIRILKSEVTKERVTIEERCMKEKKKKRRCHKKGKGKPKTIGAMNDDMTPSDNTNVEPCFSSVSLSAPVSGSVTSSASSICDNFSPTGAHIHKNNTKGVANEPSVSLCWVNEKEPMVVAPNGSLARDTVDASTCCQAHKDSKELQPFLFLACPKKCKTTPCGNLSRVSHTRRFCRYRVSEKMRINKLKKNHSQGDESPKTHFAYLLLK